MEKEKKLKIVLACALGMSSSVLVNRIRKAAQQEGIEVECEACSVNMVEEAALDADCLLLGPQADFLHRRLYRIRQPPQRLLPGGRQPGDRGRKRFVHAYPALRFVQAVSGVYLCHGLSG